MVVEPYERLPAADVDAVAAEAHRLLAFTDADAADRDVRFLPLA